MKLLEVLNGNKIFPPPLWMMRQAGRYLPEYQLVRKKNKNFIGMCLDSKSSCEVTLQPIRRFNFDASIIFSDILLVPWALGRKVDFLPNVGPILDPISNLNDIDVYNSHNFLQKLSPIKKNISLTKQKLPNNIPLIGFSGAPWTIMTYMLEGGTSRDFNNTRLCLWTKKDLFEKIFYSLIDAIVDFLYLQAISGADILMIFDTWSSHVPATERKWIVFEAHQKIIQKLNEKNVYLPIISFPKGLNEALVNYVENVNVNCLAVDHYADIQKLHKILPKEIALQGNLDPILLTTDNTQMIDIVDDLINIAKQRPYIFNLGHGILPNSKISKVDEIISYIRYGV